MIGFLVGVVTGILISVAFGLGVCAWIVERDYRDWHRPEGEE